jgi:hypothetical protein
LRRRDEPGVKLVWIAFVCLLSPTAWAGEPGWSAAAPAVRKAVRRGAPLVVQVIVPLCHNNQIYCGEHGLGSPGNLRTNLYWGALYGVPRFFARRELGYQALEDQTAPEGVLERRAFRRFVSGKPWGSARDVELIVVLDAVHGAHIDDAVRRFYDAATTGGTLSLRDGKRRRVRISAAGYAGHNRLMDGLKLPEPPTDRRAALPALVLACYSDKYFSGALERAGVTPLVTTTGFMAPEGYVVEAAVRALGEDASPAEMRAATARAYARWQRIDVHSAAWLFERR